MNTTSVSPTRSYLVVAICSADDLPILHTENRDEAFALAARLRSNSPEVERARFLFFRPGSEFVRGEVLLLEDGLPVAMLAAEDEEAA